MAPTMAWLSMSAAVDFEFWATAATISRHRWRTIDASAPAGTGASHGTRATGSHTVRPGESLWSITADLLHTTDRGAIASAWPTLWAANRVVVGRDPGLIRPGTVLQVPEALLPA